MVRNWRGDGLGVRMDGLCINVDGGVEFNSSKFVALSVARWDIY